MKHAGYDIGIAIMALVAGAFFVGFLVTLGDQILVFLKSGQWFPVSISDALLSLSFKPPRFAWLGVQRIFEWFLDQSLAVAMLLTAAVVGMLTLQLMDERNAYVRRLDNISS